MLPYLVGAMLIWINLSGSLADENCANDPCSFATRNTRGLLTLPSLIIVLKGERNGLRSRRVSQASGGMRRVAYWLLG